MKICHFSDWHGTRRELPEADLYVCTGDMLPNTKACMWVDKAPERLFQREWIERHPWSLDKPVFVVRGNHDYVDLMPLFFPGCSGWEFIEGEKYTYDGLVFGGFRGVLPIAGIWADEMCEAELEIRCQMLGPVDVLITHTPPFGRLDNDRLSFGSQAVRKYVDKCPPKAHLFGHIHEAAGTLTVNGTVFSNAACGINIFEVT